MSAADARAEMIASIRALADFLADNPDVPAPDRIDAQYSATDYPEPPEAQRIAEVERVAALIGCPTVRNGRSVVAKLNFGPRVVYKVHASTDVGTALYYAESSYHGSVQPAAEVRAELHAALRNGGTTS